MGCLVHVSARKGNKIFISLFLLFHFFFHAFGVPRLLRLSTIESQNPPYLLSLLRLRRSTNLSVITASPPCSPSDETLNQSWKPRETLSGSHVVSSIFSPSEIGLFLCFALIQVCQFRVSLVKDTKKHELMWESQHDVF